ncbi:ARM repeat-containing protein [Whalleya microplaca]|nr:ARM repeat-containing protein [Whalleya microplaca]
MKIATRLNGFPNLTMGSSNDKSAQPLSSSFSNSSWQPNTIWGNSGAAIGSSLVPRRDVVRGSSAGVGSAHATGALTRTAELEDPSPTVSGSAQLNANSQAAPWGSQGRIWNQSGNQAQGASSSGNTSPTRTRDGFPHNFSDVSNNGNIFQPRPSTSQNGTNLPSRTMPPGPMDPSTSSFKYPTGLRESIDDERANSSLYGSIGNSQLELETQNGIYRRKSSNDPSFLNLGQTRQNGLNSRQPESDVPTPSHRYGDSTHYPFQKLSAQPKPHAQRPSLPNVSVTLPSESGRNSAFTYGTADAPSQSLEDSFRRGLNLDDPSEPTMNGYGPNGYYDPAATQPFTYNPNSQTWQHTNGGNSRAFGQSIQSEPWAEPMMGPNYASKRGSVDRSSPIGSSYRPSLNSPRGFSGTPNPRADPWTRPGSRDTRMLPEFSRQPPGSHYLQQQENVYPPYYNNSSLSQFSTTTYDQFVQAPSFRPHMQVPGYGMQVNYPGFPIPARPSRDQDPGKGVRSMLLEEFRSNNKSNKRYELKDIYNHIVEFSGDQHGSRFIQEKLQTANSDEKDQVFREIEPNTLQLMKDVFGNYVIQKFFEHGNQVQKKIIAAQMKGKVAELSTQMYACRVVQKALEHVLDDQQIEIVNELKPDIMRIVKDQNGNHVVQKIIQMMPKHCIPFIMDAFQNHIEALASHSYGCRVIQRILEYGREEEKRALMTDLHACAARLITDQYGNYVTQHIIARGEPEDRRRVIQIVMQKLLVYSKHKYASNVVEKSIEFGTAEDRKAIRAQLTTPHSDGTSPLNVMMKDQFGNYVIQKLMSNLEPPDRESFIEEMKPQFANLKKVSTGRQITALDRLMTASSTIPTANNTNGVAASASTAPLTPSLLVEVNSAAPTPSLTMEQNSPESSSPPSTNDGTLEEATDVKKNSKVSPLDGQSYGTVEVTES